VGRNGGLRSYDRKNGVIIVLIDMS
jgi:hypothetical protein